MLGERNCNRPALAYQRLFFDSELGAIRVFSQSLWNCIHYDSETCSRLNLVNITTFTILCMVRYSIYLKYIIFRFAFCTQRGRPTKWYSSTRRNKYIVTIVVKKGNGRVMHSSFVSINIRVSVFVDYSTCVNITTLLYCRLSLDMSI